MLADNLRQEVQDRVKHAVVHMGDVRDKVVRALAERLEFDLDRLRGRRDAVLRQVGRQSERLASQDAVPMPEVLRSTLDRLQGLLEQVVPEVEESPTVMPGTARPRAHTSQPARAAEPSLAHVAGEALKPDARPARGANRSGRKDAVERPRTTGGAQVPSQGAKAGASESERRDGRSARPRRGGAARARRPRRSDSDLKS